MTDVLFEVSFALDEDEPEIQLVRASSSYEALEKIVQFSDPNKEYYQNAYKFSVEKVAGRYILDNLHRPWRIFRCRCPYIDGYVYVQAPSTRDALLICYDLSLSEEPNQESRELSEGGFSIYVYHSRRVIDRKEE